MKIEPFIKFPIAFNQNDFLRKVTILSKRDYIHVSSDEPFNETEIKEFIEKYNSMYGKFWEGIILLNRDKQYYFSIDRKLS